MSFSITKMETRVANMVSWFAGLLGNVTDFIVGGKVRTKFEAIAVEMERQDLQIYQAIKKAIPSAIYLGFNFPLLPAVKASTVMTFSAASAPDNDIQIPVYTRVFVAASGAVPEKIYETLTAAILPSGETSVNITVACTQAGAIGNTAASTITSLKSPISGITSVNNVSRVDSGRDQELEDSRKLRFQEYVTTLQRGTEAALVYAAKSTAIESDGVIVKQVTQAVVVGPGTDDPGGACTVYIYDGNLNNDIEDLIAAVQLVIDGDRANDIAGYKAAGVKAPVVAATVSALDVSKTIVSQGVFDKPALQAKIISLTSEYIKSLKIGENWIANEDIQRTMDLDGVVDVTGMTPDSNQAPANNHTIFVPGTIGVTV